MPAAAALRLTIKYTSGWLMRPIGELPGFAFGRSEEGSGFSVSFAHGLKVSP
jgi:hypothetical protein